MKNGKLLAVVCSVVFLLVGLVMGYQQAQVTVSETYETKADHESDLAALERRNVRNQERMEEKLDTLIALRMQRP